MVSVQDQVEQAITKVWRPNSGKQEVFLSIPDTIFEVLYGGAAGGGKSDAILMTPLVRQFYQIPTYHGIILRRTFKQLDDELIPRSQDWYKASGATWNDTKKRWKWSNGAIQDFGHAENEADIRNYDTAEYNFIGFDELTSFTEFQYIYLASTRCRSKDSRLPAIVRSGTNPGNIGHGWVRKRFVEPAREGFKILVDKVTGNKRMFIPALASDNPKLLEANPTYLRQLEMLPEAEKRAKLYGDWYTFTGQVFDEFRFAHMPGEPENALHVIPPINPPSYLPRILAIDWGYSANTVAGIYAAYPNKRAIKFKEYVTNHTKIAVWASEVAKMCQGENIKYFVLCRSGWQQRGDEQTIMQQIDEILYPIIGVHPDKADNDRVGGKMLMHEYLRFVKRPERYAVDKSSYNKFQAEYILRNGGINAYNNYLAQFKDDIEDDSILPKLRITSNCTETIKCIPLCVYDSKNPEDVAEFTGDDAYDETRYGIKALDHFYVMAGRNETEALKTVEVCQEYERTKDYNRFNNRMSYIEQTATKVHAVKRRSAFR